VPDVLVAHSAERPQVPDAWCTELSVLIVQYLPEAARSRTMYEWMPSTVVGSPAANISSNWSSVTSTSANSSDLSMSVMVRSAPLSKQ
jgi:hypothetical protein